MVPLKVIADSDDEDDDVLTALSPFKDYTPPTAGQATSSNTTTTHASDSTDPRLFRAIYAQQQQSMTENPAPSASQAPESIGASLLGLLQSIVQAETQAEPESTVPFTSSAELRRYSEIEPQPSRDLSTSKKQLTSNDSRDVWDIPSSPERSARMIGKRHKRVDLGSRSKRSKDRSDRGLSDPTSSIAGSDVKSFSVRKGKKEIDASSSSRQPDVLTSQDINRIMHRNVGSSMSELAQTSLYVEPITLSPSRRKLYQSLEPSSASDGDMPQLVAEAASSNATTIAYATPSQYRTTAQDDTDEHHLSPLPEGREMAPAETCTGIPHSLTSSPDIISMNDRAQIQDSGEDKPRPRRRSDRAHKTDHPTEEKIEDIKASQCTINHTETTKRSRGLFDSSPNSLPPPKRRGRPKKSRGGVSSITNPDEADETKLEIGDLDGTVPNLSPKVPTVADAASKKEKKRRGRPRKSEAISTQPTNAKVQDVDVFTAPGLSGNGQNGRGLSKDVADDQTPVEVLHDSHLHVSKATLDLDRAEGEMERKVLPTINQEAPSGLKQRTVTLDTGARSTPTPGKPVYRIGLSRRSRIAPLLRSLPKT